MSETRHHRDTTSPDTSDVVIEVVRLMRLRADEDAGAPSRVVAHVQARDGSSSIASFGQVDVRIPAEQAHLNGPSWDVMERVIDSLPGKRLCAAPGSGVDQLLDPVLAQLGQQTREAIVQKERAGRGRERGALERQARRTVRLGVNVMRRRPLDAHPERKPASLIGVAALQLALQGVIAQLSTGESYGETARGTWFTGKLDAFYDEHLDSVSRTAVAPAPAPPSIDGQAANSFPDAEYIQPLPKDGTKGHLLEREALSFGLSSVRYPNGTFVVSDDAGRQMNFKWGRSPIASGVSLSICSYKEATRRLLTRVNVPVPYGRVFSVADIDKALDYADRIGYPVVCKPVAGLRGIGVVADIRNREDLVRALELYTHSELGSDDFVIEQHVPGEDYRIVVINGEVVASVVREPASVTGDGIHTVADLVEYKNRARLKNPHLSSRLILFSESMQYQLAQNGLTLGSVPEKGQQVMLANSANLSQGGDSFEVAHELHPTVKEVAVRAVEAVPGLGFCGLDMLIEDHKLPVDQQRATVIELNAHAAIGSAQYPMWGTPTPVARMFFEASAEAYGIELPRQPAETLSVDVEVRGRVGGITYQRWLRRRAEQLGVDGAIQRVGPRKVLARMQGHADAVSALVYLACRGPRRAIPTSVTTTHRTPFDAFGFRIEGPQLRRDAILRRVVRRAKRKLSG